MHSTLPRLNLIIPTLKYNCFLQKLLTCENLQFCPVVYPLPNDKILDVTKSKTFADNKLNVTNKTTSLYVRVENTLGKGENAGYQHFLLFRQCFPQPPSFTHYQTTNFRLVQTETVCRRQF